MLRVGTILHGTYRVDGYLASGGFGNTYAVTNVQFGERYAIKEFFMKGVTERDDNATTISVSNLENVSSFEAQKEKFKKEAVRLRKLSSPNIVRVHDLFEENGTAYYVMDFVDGENLRDQLKRLGHPLDEAAVWQIFDQVIDALEVVHAQGLFHLDLKPANFMMDKQGHVLLIDFGASKQMKAGSGATTSTGVSYSNGYAPREQMEQALDKFGPWTDFYALGATLYFLLTGKQPPIPSDIDDDESEDKHVALPLPAGLSDKLRRLVLWLMATNRNRRPQSVGEIRQYLAQSATSASEPASADEEEEEVTVVLDKPKTEQPAPESAPKPAEDTIVADQSVEEEQPEPKKSKWPLIALVLVFAVIGFFGIGLLTDGSDEPSASDKAQVTDTTSIDTASATPVKAKDDAHTKVEGAKAQPQKSQAKDGKSATSATPATKTAPKREQPKASQRTSYRYDEPTYRSNPSGGRPSKNPTSGGSSDDYGYSNHSGGGKNPTYGTSSSKQNTAGSSDD